MGDFGFETFHFEHLTFRDQVELLSQAEAIASTSGAALMNILFAPPGLKLLVLVEPVEMSHVYWTMAEAAGHEYWYAMGETVLNPPPSPGIDLRVSPDKIANTLQAMLR